MKRDFWRNVALSIGLLLGLAAVAWAGHHQTNPNHHKHYIHDENNHQTQLKAKLRLGWRGHEGVLDQIKYELWNTGSLTFSVVGVRIVRKSDGEILWCNEEHKTIRGHKKGKKEWRGNWLHNKKIQRSGIEMQLMLKCGIKYWILDWDPDVGGSASTRIVPGNPSVPWCG